LEGGAASPLRSRCFLAYGVAMLGVAIALPHAGFIITGLAATLLVAKFGENRPWREALLWSAALVASIVLIFGTALGVPFPTGPMERLLAPLGLIHLG
jgi:hypothetical protein